METTVTSNEPDWVPPGVDTKRANPARVYDYWLGGTHNFLADQDVGRAVAAVQPTIREVIRANRALLDRVVRFLAEAGIRQFLDIGSGIPTQGNVHEIAEQAAPGSRVVYVDIDLVAVAHSEAILAESENATVIAGDLREPERILAHDKTRSLIDFGQPVGVLLSAVLHFITDKEDPWRITRTLGDSLVPGSYLLVNHAFAEEEHGTAEVGEKVYNRRVSTDIHFRSRADILRFFDGFELVDPGLVRPPQWRPDSPQDVPSDTSAFMGLAGVGRKRDR
jgi:S-adenosyl methyltransferase